MRSRLRRADRSGQIPAEKHDIIMNFILTPTRWLASSASKLRLLQHELTPGFPSSSLPAMICVGFFGICAPPGAGRNLRANSRTKEGHPGEKPSAKRKHPRATPAWPPTRKPSNCAPEIEQIAADARRKSRRHRTTPATRGGTGQPPLENLVRRGKFSPRRQGGARRQNCRSPAPLAETDD